ncbi:MAG: cytochrome c [Candidatus Acidiferrum sp.]|jgi:cytochrome c5
MKPMRKLLFALAGALLAACSLKVFATPQTPQAATTQKPATTVSKKASVDLGAQKFQENCGRCHNPPDALSPREVKAVVQHMRVRAMLTAEDEKLILKFLAP